MNKVLTALVLGAFTVGVGCQSRAENVKRANIHMVAKTASDAGWKYVSSANYGTGQCSGCADIELNFHQMVYGEVEGINSEGNAATQNLCCLIRDNDDVITYCQMNKKPMGCTQYLPVAGSVVGRLEPKQ